MQVLMASDKYMNMKVTDYMGMHSCAHTPVHQRDVIHCILQYTDADVHWDVKVASMTTAQTETHSPLL